MSRADDPRETHAVDPTPDGPIARELWSAATRPALRIRRTGTIISGDDVSIGAHLIDTNIVDDGLGGDVVGYLDMSHTTQAKAAAAMQHIEDALGAYATQAAEQEGRMLPAGSGDSAPPAGKQVDPDKPCQHEHFVANVDVARIQKSDDDPTITAFMAEIHIDCEDCGESFRWAGVKAGMNYAHPMCSPDERELRAPIRPASADQDFGMGLPGFSINYRGAGE